jgi:hypothetical protein
MLFHPLALDHGVIDPAPVPATPATAATERWPATPAWHRGIVRWGQPRHACRMRRVPDGGRDEWKQLLRAQAERDAAALVPRPGHPIYALSAPTLAPARVTQSSLSNGEWTSITLAYGLPGASAGPRVTVTTSVRGSGLAAARLGSTERSPDAESRQETGSVMVTVATWGVAMDAVRIAPVQDLRPTIEATCEDIIQRIERRRREPRPPLPPLPSLPSADGVAALRALADFTMAASSANRAPPGMGHGPRHGPDWGRMHQALWQRAVRERQRLGGVAAQAADEDVTSAVNHLGHLLEQAPWFAGDARLREAAIDETLRYAMLGGTVPSIRAQHAWTAYWSAHMSGGGRVTDPEALVAWVAARQPLIADWLAAWAVWAASA